MACSQIPTLCLLFGVFVSTAASQSSGRIVFVNSRDGNQEIYTMNADGTNPVRLKNNAAVDKEPSWSPDGSMIAFTSRRDGNDEIYRMKADGTGNAALAFNGFNESPG